MRTPARAQLGRRYAGQPIGYRLLTLDRQPYAPFTREGVVEAQPPGSFAAAPEGPAAGGWIVWGTAGNPDIAEAELPPAPPTVDLAPIREALAGLVAQFVEALPAPPAPVVDTAPFEAGVQEVTRTLKSAEKREASARKEAAAQTAAAIQQLAEGLQRLDHLNQAAEEVAALSDARAALNEALADRPAALNWLARTSTARMAGSLNQILEAANRQRSTPPEALTLLDDLLARLEGGS